MIIDGKLERIWKGIVTIYWRFCSANCVQGLKKTTKSEVTVVTVKVRVPAEYKENISRRREKERRRMRRKK
jgi:hypothetical protein